ncbi:MULTISPECIES: hypothetical protein [unclassified Pseudomonas]|jgi:hypothetical protein|uniref:hypothetical protein n=1 Tax=unclassified Pseudomonas TaxID=196821 RepID=UPI001F2E7628|nr:MULTISPECIES: hypothetical protein [unclassified Pseudomonas]MCF5233101.1 hypothetical protein [Pseudomonas sp. PA-5-4H]MCF5237404.1 hypothetical protein [Pseudomonas sp. PA-5-4G]MCF5245982.1 hypothetical protein [Pseudomonas sp. PA-5-4B]MCF5252690.1 hypothetical protein [Pseudomonas sp. PA-5-4B]MCF5257963.1 hypothetical protein [Pseudomonas sp. PA-5-4A]
MKIHFMPQQRLDGVKYQRVGPYQIEVNGELFDFSRLQEGDELIAPVAVKSTWFAHRVSVEGEHLCLALLVPVASGFNFSGVRPVDVTIEHNGVIEVPQFKEVVHDN